MADSPVKRSTHSSNKTPVALEPHRPFGKYHLFEKISKGGMSDIYLARTLGIDGFQKPIVIKKLLPEYSKKPRFVSRFLNEGKTLAHLNNSNIVQVIDMGVVEGDYFIALEYIEGRNAAHVLARAKRNSSHPSLEFALHVVLEVAKALAYAHKRADPHGKNLMLVHQDVNSFNVMISYEAEVKVIDFGIARIFLNQKTTRKQPVAGKLIYFSPEQLQNTTIDRRVDIYGTGLLLYEMLTGERLVQHQETDVDTIKMILEMDVKEQVERHELIPEDLKPILLSTLAPDPDDRYSWIDDLIEDIRSVVRQRSLQLNHGEFAEYMKGMFPREILIDKRRLRKMLASEMQSPDQERRKRKKTSRAKKNRSSHKEATDNGAPKQAEDPKPANAGSLVDVPPKIVHYASGTIIFQQGEAGTDLFMVEQGRVKIYVEAGRKQHTLSILEKGDFFGETALLDRPYRSANAVALDDVDLVTIPKETFPSLISRNLAYRLITRLAEKLRDTEGVIESHLFEDSLSRLIFVLHYLHRRGSLRNGDEIDLEEISDLFRLEPFDRIRKYVEKLASVEVLEADGERIKLTDSEKLDNIHKILTSSGELTLNF